MIEKIRRRNCVGRIVCLYICVCIYTPATQVFEMKISYFLVNKVESSMALKTTATD